MPTSIRYMKAALLVLSSIGLTTSCDCPYCELGECAPNEKVCSVSGEYQCVDKLSTAWGCGAPQCTPCALPNAKVSICSANGSCEAAECNDGFRDCNASQQDGCETDIEGDERNCGSCGNDCSTQLSEEFSDGSRGVVGCALGQCVMAYCPDGWDDCDGDAKNGCECQSDG